VSADQRDRVLALEAWEAALTAYAAEAATLVSNALAALNAGLPGQRPPDEDLDRLLAMRDREEEAMARCTGAPRCRDQARRQPAG
jgi:hypothetical protein